VLVPTTSPRTTSSVTDTRVSVVVPTRNRPEHAAACASLILATDGFVELIMVDQSDDCATEASLSRIDDRRFRYVRTPTRGVTSARNLGMQLSTGDIVAFTDDDCRIRKDWVARIVDVFAADPEAVIVCGRVCVPAEVQSYGWAEEFQPRRREWQGRFPPFGDWGITANLSLRRSILQRVGPFDPMLGAGAPLRSGGETDFLFRVLRAGFKVVNAQEVVVDHLGVRKLGDEARSLVENYGVGTAAALFKHVRLGDPSGIWVYSVFLFSAARCVLAKLLSGQRPIGATFLIAFLSGTVTSFRFRIDRGRRQYARRREFPLEKNRQAAVNSQVAVAKKVEE
jgi:glycosyltransferase involved in cell wall biosynthesis